ncbi:MAG: magnesium transporter [Porphyromonas sp.]|nr:magnesium transporter [Porphyromonas sp.]
MKELTKEQTEEILELIRTYDKEGLQRVIPNLYPADIAELMEEVPMDETLYFYRLLPGPLAADVLMELDEEERSEVLEELSNEEIADTFLEYMDTDDATDLLQELDEHQQKAILAYVEDLEQVGEIEDLLKYKEDTAGGVMRKEMVVVNENWAMPKCEAEMRAQAQEVDEMYYIYVVDDEYKLRGILPLKTLITNPFAPNIKQVMKADPVFLHVHDSIETVISTFDRYDLVAIPVADSFGHLVGVITVDDVVDEMREQHERDLRLASGLSQDVESSDKLLLQVGARLPWLLLGMVGGILNSILLGGYESVFMRNPSFSLFIPMIGATGGNVGMQASAIVVQGLANKSIKIGQTVRLLLKELSVALVNALIICLVVFIYNYFYLGDFMAMLSVSLSLFILVITSSFLGTAIPLLMSRFKLDPARATGPFITILNDLLGMFVYMSTIQILYMILT